MEDLERKEKEVFVRNLAYNVTQDDLMELFQEYGPIKRTTVVQQDGVSRGFGFIKFALEDDAQLAVSKLQGYEFHGRKMILEIAVQRGQTTKPPVGERAVTTLPSASYKVEEEKPKEPISAESDKALARPSMQVAVCGVPSTMKKKEFKEAVQKVCRSKKLIVELMQEGHPMYSTLSAVSVPAGRVMILTVRSRKDANALVERLDGATPKSLGFPGNDVTEKLSARLMKDVTLEGYRKRKCRVILRNLSFQAVEENVSSRLRKIGPLVEVSIPRVEIPVKGRRGEEGAVKLRPRGFGFATFLCESDAKRAVNGGCAGMRICNREFAVDMCENKHAHEVHGAGEKSDNREEDENSMTLCENDKCEAEEAGGENEEDTESDTEDEDRSVPLKEASDIESDKCEEADTEGNEEDCKVSAEDDVQEGRTVFVRDLPFDCSVGDIMRSFRRYGHIEMAIIVKDKVTGLSKGSAFVKFSTREGALQCIESGEILGGTSTSDKKFAKGPPSVQGRPCRVALAVDRSEAKRLKDEENVAGRDKRNLYLATEGLLVDSAVSLKRHGNEQQSNEEMSEDDRQKRRRAQTEKKKKLQNPLFFISPTRLCIRNLKKSMNNSDLHNLCVRAAGAGVKHRLVSEKDSEAYLAAQCVPVRERTKTKLAIPPVSLAKGNKVVVKAKIMFDRNKLRGVKGTPQSRGYGFVEFVHHVHALACLRELNNNREYGRKYAQGGSGPVGKAANLIVEFSLENMQKVMILNSRRERSGLSQGDLGSDFSDSNSDDENNIHIDDGGHDGDIPEGNVEDLKSIGKRSRSDSMDSAFSEKKKSRLERKKEYAAKRKAKEQRRKENKRRKLEETSNNSTSDTFIEEEATTTGVNSGAKKTKKSHGQSNNDTSNVSDVQSNSWRGFKRYRAAKKAGKSK